MQACGTHDPALLPAPADASERSVAPGLVEAYAASVVEVRAVAEWWTVEPLAGVDPAGAAETAAFPTGVRQLSVLTACNPRSRRLTEQENASRDLHLRHHLDALGLRWWPALNRAVGDDTWDEPSVAVHDLSIEDGVAIAHDLDQAAYHVWTPGRLTLVWVPLAGRVTADQRAATTLRRPAT